MKQTNQTFKRSILITVILISIGILVFQTLLGTESNASSNATDLVIPKKGINATAKFFPYKADKTYMEVIAVKAPDGSIRTALNTCQVCFNSGRGYYTQQGNELVCNNCGNRFRIDQIELIKGGCNPVPITKEFKKEDDKNIYISKEFLSKNKVYFSRWKR